MNYNYIINPVNNIHYLITSNKGKNILKQFIIEFYKYGGKIPQPLQSYQRLTNTKNVLNKKSPSYLQESSTLLKTPELSTSSTNTNPSLDTKINYDNPVSVINYFWENFNDKSKELDNIKSEEKNKLLEKIKEYWNDYPNVEIDNNEFDRLNNIGKQEWGVEIVKLPENITSSKLNKNEITDSNSEVTISD